MITQNEPSNASASVKPKVVIGVPVFNEIKYIKKSLDSLLSLKYENLEILISDNCSTDGTSELIAEAVLNDSRIKYIKHPENLGVHANFQYCLNHSECDYFMWGSGHDLWSKNLIADSVDYLERDERCVLAYGMTTCVDENGDLSTEREFPTYDTIGMRKALARMHFVLWGSMNPFLGLYRKSELKNIKLVNVVGSDLLYLLELSMKGTFKLIPKENIYRREVRKIETYSQRMKRYASEDLSPYKNMISKLLPICQLGWSILGAIYKSNLVWYEKILALISFIFCFPAKLLIGKANP